MAQKLFPIVPRGYDRAQVDELFARADAALAGDDPAGRTAAREELASATFVIALRGYSPTDVAMAVEQRLSALS